MGGRTRTALGGLFQRQHSALRLGAPNAGRTHYFSRSDSRIRATGKRSFTSCEKPCGRAGHGTLCAIFEPTIAFPTELIISM
jgi:hypothetical protein